MVELFGVLDMETSAVGPAKQENTPKQEQATTDEGEMKKVWEINSETERQEIKQKKEIQMAGVWWLPFCIIKAEFVLYPFMLKLKEGTRPRVS